MLTDTFSQIFREEHRKVRDTLLDLIKAFQDRDKTRIQALLHQTAAYTGPHFRYEEEALYPGLVGIFGESYIEKLLDDHDRAIGAAQRVVELARKEPLTGGDVAEAVRLVRGLLPHVSDCEGLSIMVERLPDAEVQSVLDARESSNRDNLDLIQWATQVRRRPPVRPE